MSRPLAAGRARGAAGSWSAASVGPWARGLMAVAVVPGLILLAGTDGLPATRVPMSGGGAWLASSALGYLTLLDGSSEQVVGSVRVPGGRAGDDLAVTQAGSSAYVVDTTRGSVSRVDGGTYEVSESVRFGTGGGQPVSLFAGEDSLYVVDGSRQLASVTDPLTLRVRRRLPIAAQPGPGQALVDGSGRLWVADSASTSLSRFDPTGTQVRSELGGPDARLVLVKGQPALVDLAQRRAGRLDSSGRVPSWSCLEVPAHARPQLLGSASSGWLVAAIGASGTLVGANLDSNDCGLAVTVGKPGDEFGPLVQSGSYVFVPDRSTGRTAVVDLGSREVIQLDLLKPGSRLELVAKDGMVFYNDAGADLAGVIKFDGRQWQAGRALKKYDKAHAGPGLLTPAGGNTPADDPAKNKPDPPAAGHPATPDPQRPAGQPTPPGQRPGVPKLPPHIFGVGVSPSPVVLGVPATFRATVLNATGANWHWVVSTDAGSVVESTSAGTFRHTFPAGSPDRLQVRVTVTTPIGSDSATAGFTTTSTRVPAIGAVVASPASPDVGQQVTFTADEPVAGAQGSWTWRIATLAGSQVLPPTARPALAPFTHSFTAVGSYRVTLTVAFAGRTDTRSVDVTVTDQCVLQGDASTIDFRTATAASVQVSWTNCFASAKPAVSLDAWLRGASTIRNGRAGAGTLTVRLTPGGPAPAEALQPKAIRFTLESQSMSVDAFPPVSTPPDAVDLTVISDRATTSLGSGPATIQVSGPEFAGPAGAGATDGYGPVTSIELQETSPGYTCVNPDTGATVRIASEGDFQTLSTQQGAKVNVVITTPPLPCPAMMVQDTMQFSFRARATGPGGTTGFTGEVHVNWSRQ